MRKKNNTAPTGQINMVGDETVFEGTLRARSDVRVSGEMIGTLDVAGRAIVAEGGLVEGEIVADNVDVAGTVNGELQVSGRVVLRSSAKVEGNIVTEHIVVEEGAVFNGTCQMGQQQETPASTFAQSSDNETAEPDAEEVVEEAEEEEVLY